MPNSIEIQISDQIVADLDAATLSQDIESIADTDPANLATVQDGTAVRTYLPEYALKDYSKTRITVIPSGYKETRLSRSAFREEYQVDLLIEKRLSSEAAGDAMGELVQEISRYWEIAARREIITGVNWLNVERDLIFRDRDLEEAANKFSSGLRHTFVSFRTAA